MDVVAGCGNGKKRGHGLLPNEGGRISSEWNEGRPAPKISWAVVASQFAKKAGTLHSQIDERN
jgi:hypothetical protein